VAEEGLRFTGTMKSIATEMIHPTIAMRAKMKDQRSAMLNPP
jgi:hypothetical protein